MEYKSNVWLLPERFSRCKKRLIFLRNCGNPRLICATQAGAKLRTWLSRPPTRSSHFGHNSPRLPSTLQSSAKRTKIKASLHANRVSDLRPEFVPLSPEWTPRGSAAFQLRACAAGFEQQSILRNHDPATPRSRERGLLRGRPRPSPSPDEPRGADQHAQNGSGHGLAACLGDCRDCR